MSPIIIMAIIATATFVLSVATSAFISGTRWGQIQSDVHDISRRLGTIEGMFTMKLKE